MRDVLDTTSVIKIVSNLSVVFPGTPFSSSNKTDRHNITEILLKVALSTIKSTNHQNDGEHESIRRRWLLTEIELFLFLMFIVTFLLLKDK